MPTDDGKIKKNELNVRQEDVWQEHLDNVKVGRHWVYLIAVIIGAFLLMVALIALLGAAS